MESTGYNKEQQYKECANEPIEERGHQMEVTRGEYNGNSLIKTSDMTMSLAMGNPAQVSGSPTDLYTTCDSSVPVFSGSDVVSSSLHDADCYKPRENQGLAFTSFPKENEICGGLARELSNSALPSGFHYYTSLPPAEPNDLACTSAARLPIEQKW
ncbi:hypothetical protein Pmani_006146 [Petrolisthes manimaculis]|uniref:Uncharacterized protein n=1 Tax=Petrolisthes manimaculis TaxID=1843537 RepID=A0AAE1QAX4_9EUCA|nr:hypothetical protein Pmani_006146 [Petrolisthes manimaculis]